MVRNHQNPLVLRGTSGSANDSNRFESIQESADPGKLPIRIDSESAKSAGQAGSIAAAHFLEAFVVGMKWIHLDIAGTSTSDRLTGYKTKGATGCPTRTLVQLACDLADGQ